MIKRSIAAFIIASFLILSVSCADYIKAEEKTLSTGKLITPEEIEKLEESFKEENVEFVIDEDTVYYWTKRGPKFHIYKDCQSFSRTDEKDILSGNFEEVTAAKKDSFCNFCRTRGNIPEDILKK